MGTQEPPEQWAPPESLDPTPVWKQYLLVGLLVLAFLAAAAGYAVYATSPDNATPPAVVANRVVLAVSEHPPGTAKRVDIAGPERAFYLVRSQGDAVAVRARWAPEVGGPERCEVMLVSAEGARFADSCTASLFDERGAVVSGTAPRGLDRYLVSRKGERLIVNLDHLIQGAHR